MNASKQSQDSHLHLFTCHKDALSRLVANIATYLPLIALYRRFLFTQIARATALAAIYLSKYETPSLLKISRS
jgi:hypothetical protein